MNQWMLIAKPDKPAYERQRCEVLTRYGVPPVLWPALEHSTVEEVVIACRAMAQVDERAVHDALTALHASMAVDFFDTEVVCMCGETFKLRDLQEHNLPGFTGRLCVDCLEREQKREQRRLTLRGIRSALARARAARLPATLTKAQWARTVEHFNGLCAYCQKSVWYVVEHATPIQLGGGTTVSNCLPACFKCNSNKASKTLEELMTNILFNQDRLIVAEEWLRACGRDR